MSIDVTEGRHILGRLQEKGYSSAELRVLFDLLDTLENLWNSRRFSFMAHAMTGTVVGVWSAGSAGEPSRLLTVDEIADRAMALADAATYRLAKGK